MLLPVARVEIATGSLKKRDFGFVSKVDDDEWWRSRSRRFFAFWEALLDLLDDLLDLLAVLLTLLDSLVLLFVLRLDGDCAIDCCANGVDDDDGCNSAEAVEVETGANRIGL